MRRERRRSDVRLRDNAALPMSHRLMSRLVSRLSSHVRARTPPRRRRARARHVTYCSRRFPVLHSEKRCQAGNPARRELRFWKLYEVARVKRQECPPRCCFAGLSAGAAADGCEGSGGGAFLRFRIFRRFRRFRNFRIIRFLRLLRQRGQPEHGELPPQTRGGD